MDSPKDSGCITEIEILKIEVDVKVENDIEKKEKTDKAESIEPSSKKFALDNEATSSPSLLSSSSSSISTSMLLPTPLSLVSFPCHLCPKENPKSFIDLVSLKKHLRIIHNHKPDRDPFICTICHQEFEKEWNYNSHCQSAHKNSCLKIEKPAISHKCSYCFKIFSSKPTLDKHLQTSAACNRIMFQCQECQKYFHFKHQLNKHYKNCHPQSSREKKKTRQKSKRRAPHKDNNANFFCQLCSQEFLDKFTLSNHISLHDDEDRSRLRCDLCSEQLSQRSSLKNHLKREHSRSFLCDVCSKSFKNQDLFNEHFERNVSSSSSDSDDSSHSNSSSDSGENGTRFICQICEEKCPSQCLLNVHTDRHLNELRIKGASN